MAKPKIAVFFGTRPEAIKLAPVMKALAADSRFELLSVSTGQHREMLDQAIDVFDLPVHHNLRVMRPGQTLAGLSARLMTGIDAILEAEKPHFTVIQGDTTTVLIASLACFYRRIPCGHVEAGLRTGNFESPFPEEANRVLTTRLCALHFPPTSVSERNLRDEGIAAQRIVVTGNTVIDALHLEVARQSDPAIQFDVDLELEAFLPADWRSKRLVLITGHRRENFGDGFESICESIVILAAKYPDVRFVYPVHLNPNVREPVERTLGRLENVYLLPPLGYRPFVALMQVCHLVLTDSGGVQEEAPGLGKPVLVMRDTTERPEGLNAGTVRLVGAARDRIVAGVSSLLDDRKFYEAMARANNPYGDGKASGRIVDAIARYLETSRHPR